MFSDKHLAVVKQHAIDTDDPALKALIARLEAAEACIKHVEDQDKWFVCLEKWKRSAGREEGIHG